MMMGTSHADDVPVCLSACTNPSILHSLNSLACPPRLLVTLLLEAGLQEVLQDGQASALVLA